MINLGICRHGTVFQYPVAPKPAPESPLYVIPDEWWPSMQISEERAAEMIASGYARRLNGHAIHLQSPQGRA